MMGGNEAQDASEIEGYDMWGAPSFESSDCFESRDCFESSGD